MSNQRRRALADLEKIWITATGTISVNIFSLPVRYMDKWKRGASKMIPRGAQNFLNVAQNPKPSSQGWWMSGEPFHRFWIAPVFQWLVIRLESHSTTKNCALCFYGGQTWTVCLSPRKPAVPVGTVSKKEGSSYHKIKTSEFNFDLRSQNVSMFHKILLRKGRLHAESWERMV